MPMLNDGSKQPYVSFPLDSYVCLASTANSVVNPTSNTATTFTQATATGYHLSPGRIVVGFDADPTSAAALTVTNQAGTATYFSQKITKGGPAPLDLRHILLPISTGMKVTLAASGGGQYGSVNVYPLFIKAGGA